MTAPTQPRRGPRVLLAGDDADVRSALCLLVVRELGPHVLGEAGVVEDILSRATEIQPDLLLLDWDLPGPRADALLAELRVACPEARVIALSTRPEMRAQALSAGADAFVCKADEPARLLAALRALFRRDTHR